MGNETDIEIDNLVKKKIRPKCQTYIYLLPVYSLDLLKLIILENNKNISFF